MCLTASQLTLFGGTVFVPTDGSDQSLHHVQSSPYVWFSEDESLHMVLPNLFIRLGLMPSFASAQCLHLV